MSAHKLRDAPVESVYLMEDFVTPAEEEYLLGRVYVPNGATWVQVSGRRLQNLGGIVDEKGMIPRKSACIPLHF